jgi:hypothetical protein
MVDGAVHPIHPVGPISNHFFESDPIPNAERNVDVGPTVFAAYRSRPCERYSADALICMCDSE